MQRKLMLKLIEWKKKADHMPLIVYGARQVGKTWLLDTFGKENFEDAVYVNFETDSKIAYSFAENINPQFLLNALETYYRKRIYPERTLIIFDEIQACEKALTSLKYFCEQAPEYMIIAAGSLLGVAVNREKYSFPVGKVEMLTLYPLDFEEFLWANGFEKLAAEIRTSYDTNTPLPEALHSLALEQYKNYLIIGGMPGAVNAYLKERRLMDAINIQNIIQNSYIADMSKYATPGETTRIMACFNSIPAQLAKDNRKFQYKVVQAGGSATMFGTSIDWLTAAGVVMKCHKIEHGMMPPAVYQDLSSFKLYMGDVGLLTLKSRISPYSILSDINETLFVGSIAENYVAQALKTNGYALYYWESKNRAEVDFVVQQDMDIIPIEVKSGTHTRSRSLTVYISRYKPSFAIRLSAKNFGFDNGIKSVPLYAAFCL
ncbi:MAG: AAA family ATPase [Actinobacteria bacterium]|nr:AAA family ATPase [Cyanobacteriota bacterium]MCL6087254.1 AAA family ATPase [Actinomycetota bacterium]